MQSGHDLFEFLKRDIAFCAGREQRIAFFNIMRHKCNLRELYGPPSGQDLIVVNRFRAAHQTYDESQGKETVLHRTPCTAKS